MLKRSAVLIAAAALLSVAAAAATAWLASRPAESICHGTVVDGRLENAQRLPYSGKNYRAYSLAGFVLGRTFMHSSVRRTIEDAYVQLQGSHPGLRFVYAESGWPWGGRFAPHKSHANGTAVDFHVPVRSRDGAVSEIPTGVFTKLGYGAEFDLTGHAASLSIDFSAMAAHLLALRTAAEKNGIAIRRVIFDPPLQKLLFAGKEGAALQASVPFSSTRSWIRHDEHYHVDFAVACR